MARRRGGRRGGGVTSPKVAKKASKQLRSGKSTKAQKSVAASALRQAKRRGGKK